MAIPGGLKSSGNLGHESSHPQSSKASLRGLPSESRKSVKANRRCPKGAMGKVCDNASAENTMHIAMRSLRPSNSTGRVMINVPAEMMSSRYRNLVSESSISPNSLARPIDITVIDHMIIIQDAPRDIENKEVAS